MQPKADAAKTLVADYRRVQHGLLSVGLKIHCLDNGQQFRRLIEGLGGAAEILEINRYRDDRASMCLVLPPVGSASSAIHLIECIERFTGSRLFANRQIQLQLCSPGRLSSWASALLGISFYLGSDTLRRYTQADLRTTFSSDYTHARGMRLVLYDAEGDFDRDFVWWNQQGLCEPELPFQNGRTDLLIGSGSRLDIQNINLVATLLVHLEYNGYWRALGEQFKVEMESLLERHILKGLLTAPWVRESSAQIGDDDRFFAVLQELVAYAYGESIRVKQRRGLWFGTWRDIPARSPNGILEEMHSLLSKYRRLLETRSPLVAQGGQPA
ncbi:MAG TPA: hypothetical protein VEW46_10120 [Pyrinomonadaceae bacterium]|nr:hypothetical protein [Pyrinomonadaceae bacterium]